MMRWIVGSSLKFRFLVLATAAALMFFGVARLRDMPVDVFPEFAPPRVEIQTEALGLSTTETESLITVPLEQALNGTPGLDILRSKSVPGLSSILLIFKPGTDLIEARQLVQERLAQVTRTLPSVAMPPVMLQPLSSTSRLMKVGLSSTQMDLIELSEVVRWKIRPRLMSVPGVANVAVWGARKKQIVVQLDSERLRENGVTLAQAANSTTSALDVGLLAYLKGAAIGQGGFIDTPNQRLAIQHVLPITAPEHLGAVTVDGTDLRLDEISDVVITHPPLIGDGVVNDDVGLLLIVEKFPWGNTLDVTRDVEAALAEMKPALRGIDVDSTIFRPATFIETALENLSMSLLIGAVLLIIVLVAFLYDWRIALISLVAMPLSLIAAGLVLYWRGATINTMILAGFVIALGDIVDDAIIDIENVVRRLRQHRQAGTNVPTARIILDASLEVRNAIVYATLIEVVAIAPVFFMEGLSGAFFRPLAFSYAIALLVSMVVALTVTPALSYLLLRNAPLEERESPLIPWFQRGYDKLLGPIVRAPRLAYAGVSSIVVAGLLVMPFLGQSLLPSFKERDFLMHWLTKPGTSHPEMLRITKLACQELGDIPGVRNCGSHIGRALAADEVVGIDFTENWISIDPAVDYDETLAKVQEAVDGYPGLYRDVQTYLKERIKEVLTGTSETIVVRIFGPDLNVLYAKSLEVKQALEGIDGIVELHEELQEDIPQMEIEVDLVAAQRYGLTPGEVRRVAATYVNGLEIGDVFRGGKVVDVRVRGTPETRHSLTSIQELLIDTPDGGHVRLADVADVRIRPTPNVIKREAVSRRIDVSANVADRDLGAVAREVESRLANVEFPREYRAVVLGEYAERQAAQSRLLLLAIAAAFGIFLLLQASFGSWRLTILSFLTLPSALVGGVLAAFTSDGVISLGSLVGFLTVLGIAARNGIMLISHYQHLEAVEGEPFGPGLVLRGAKERLAPILMTGATTGLSLVPLIVAGDIPGHEIEHPMAIVILGGLLTSTLLNLFIVPALYLQFGKGASAPALAAAGSSGTITIPLADDDDGEGWTKPVANRIKVNVRRRRWVVWVVLLLLLAGIAYVLFSYLWPATPTPPPGDTVASVTELQAALAARASPALPSQPATATMEQGTVTEERQQGAAGVLPQPAAPSAMLPSADAGPTGTTMTPAPAFERVMDNTFDAATRSWPERTTETIRAEYADGGYQLTLNGQPSTSISAAFPGTQYRVSGEVTTTQGHAGIVFLSVAPASFYYFLVNTDGAYAIQIWDHATNTLRDEVQWTQSAALKRGAGVTNRLRIERHGTRLAVFANEELLTELAVPPGEVVNQYGVVLAAPEGQGQARFDNLVVEQAAPSTTSTGKEIPMK